jgi:hypothetical protein
MSVIHWLCKFRRLSGRMMTRKLSIPSGPKKEDHAAAVSRAVVGVVPIVGPALAEIISTIIPNQRLERLEAYLVHLTAQLEETSVGKTQNAANLDASDIKLIEDGAFESSRS